MPSKRKIIDERESSRKRSKSIKDFTPLCFNPHETKYHYSPSNDDDDDDASSVGSNEIINDSDDESESPPPSETYLSSSPNQKNGGILTNSWSANAEREKEEEEEEFHFMDDFLVNVSEEEKEFWMDLQLVIIDHNQNTLGEFRKVDKEDDEESLVNLTQMFDDFICTHDKDEYEAESMAPNWDKCIQSSEIPRSGAVLKEDEIEKDEFMMDDLLEELAEEETMFWRNYLSVINGNNENDFGELSDDVLTEIQSAISDFSLRV